MLDWVYNATGEFIKVTAFAAEGSWVLSPENVVNNSGMSGENGIFKLHDDMHDSAWMTINNPGNKNWIMFDLGSVCQIGYMFIWNFNQKFFAAAGLKDVSVFYSYDAVDWTELKGSGYPYRFAKAPGDGACVATNLDLPGNPPLDFGGISARFVKLVPDSRCGIGNWGEYIEKQHRFGLSEIKFTAYKPEIHAGNCIPFTTIFSDKIIGAENIANSRGLSDNSTVKALMSDNQDDMALSEIMPKFNTMIFEFDGIYPLAEMHVWNYNAGRWVDAGIRDCRIYISVDGNRWKELEGSPFRFAKATGKDGLAATNLDNDEHTPVIFQNIRTRFVKLEIVDGIYGTWGGYAGSEHRYGLSKIRFVAGKGYCTEPARDWTCHFSSYKGWCGADGIFSFPIDSKEYELTASEAENKKSFFVFSDSMIGEVNPVNGVRKSNVMVNNAMAYINGIFSDQIRPEFCYGLNNDKTFTNIFPNNPEREYYYWLQDGVVINGKFYVFTSNIVHDPTQPPEGFQFKMLGVDMIRMDIVDGRLDYSSVKYFDTNLWNESGVYFGCGVMNNSAVSGIKGADGYIYIYGMKRIGFWSGLCVSRVLPENIENMSMYEFFDGDKFAKDISASAVISQNGASEMSVCPITFGEYAGKYLYTHVEFNIGRMVVGEIADNPTGPFKDTIQLFHIEDSADICGSGIWKVYTYNAKAHPHLGRNNELLVSYNMNTMDYTSHFLGGNVYHPRFFRIRSI